MIISVLFSTTPISSQPSSEAVKAGKTEEVEAIKRISPVAWRHVNLIGRFEFGSSTANRGLRTTSQSGA